MLYIRNSEDYQFDHISLYPSFIDGLVWVFLGLRKPGDWVDKIYVRFTSVQGGHCYFYQASVLFKDKLTRELYEIDLYRSFRKNAPDWYLSLSNFRLKESIVAKKKEKALGYILDLVEHHPKVTIGMIMKTY